MKINWTLVIMTILIPTVVKADITFCGWNQTPWQIFFKAYANYCPEYSGWEPVNNDSSSNFYTATGLCQDLDWGFEFTWSEDQSENIFTGDAGDNLRGNSVTINVFCATSPCDATNLSYDVLIGQGNNNCGTGKVIMRKRISLKEAPVRKKMIPRPERPESKHPRSEPKPTQPEFKPEKRK